MQRMFPMVMVCALSSACVDVDAETQEVSSELISTEPGGELQCDVLSVKRWRPPIRIGIDSNRSLTYPAIAASNNGSAIAAWLLQDTQVMVNRYARSGLFSQWSAAPTSLATFANAGRFLVAAPAVATDDTGHAVVVWMEAPSLNSYLVKARRFDPATNTWSPTSTLGTSQFQVPTAPSVAMDGAGNAIAVWENQTSPFTADVMYSQLPAAGAWTAAAILDTSAGAARRPRVAAAPSGAAVVVWTQESPAELRVIARELIFAAWSPVTVIDGAPDGISATEVQLDVGTNGNILVTWLANERLYATAGTTGAWTFVAPQLVNTPPAGTRSLPGMPAVDAAGNGVIAWSHQAGAGYARRMIGGALDATTTTLSVANAPHVDVDDAGNAFVVSTSGANARANRLTHRAARPQCPETWTSQASNVALFRGGNAVAVWRELDEPTGDAVYAALYN
jgi:hypothetical protein